MEIDNGQAYEALAGTRSMNQRIPKRIIQTGKSLDLPIQARAAVATVKLLNPDFEYLFFDDQQVETFLGSQFPEYVGLFHSFRFPIQKYDFFRYLAIYKYGGFYFDLDVFLAGGLDPLLDLGCVFPFEELTINDYFRREHGMDWEIGNYAFGAAPGHPFIAKIIDNCVRAQKDPSWIRPMIESLPFFYRERYRVLCSTGPGLASRTLAEYSEVDRPVEVLFPKRVWDPSEWHHFGSFGIHLMEGTWARRTSDLLTRFIRIWERRKIKKVIEMGKRAGATRSLEFKKKD
jgi:hypothetical protein